MDSPQSTLCGPSQGAKCSALDSCTVTRALTGLERRLNGPFADTPDTVVTHCRCDPSKSSLHVLSRPPMRSC